MEIFFMVGFSAFAFLLGGAMRDAAWRGNARDPSRMLSKDQMYKVVRLDSSQSWGMLDIHADERGQNDE
jgi:hypothetical protein